MAAGFTLGIFPILGCTTPLCVASSVLGRLNIGIMYGVSWAVTALKLALIFPFLRLGEWLFQAEPFRLSLAELSARWADDWLATVSEFGMTFVHATVGWLVCAPLVGLLFYLLALRPIRGMARTVKRKDGALSATSVPA